MAGVWEEDVQGRVGGLRPRMPDPSGGLGFDSKSDGATVGLVSELCVHQLGTGCGQGTARPEPREDSIHRG